MRAMRFDIAIADIHHGNLVHFNTAVAVFGIDPKHRCPVFTHAEIKFRQLGHGPPTTQIPQLYSRMTLRGFVQKAK